VPPTCISSPHLVKYDIMRLVPFWASILDSKAKAPLSTYKMQYMSKKIPCVKVFRGWMVIQPMD